MIDFVRSCFLLGLLLTLVISFDECGRSAERERDQIAIDCRMCKAINVDAANNCPSQGYDCDQDLLMTSNVLIATDDCLCSQMKCAAGNASLAVGGAIVKKVLCKRRKWTTPANWEASSAVCARKCDMCKMLPSSYFDNQDTYGQLEVFPPDANHPCAWADCQIGAIASNETYNRVYKGVSSFACSGDRRWKYTGPSEEARHLDDVACIIKDCEALPFGGDSAICQSKYVCYEPDFDDGDGEDWKKMTCPEPLRLSEEYKETAPTCKIGQWSADSSEISNTTKVVCVTCHNVEIEPTDSIEPITSLRNKEVTCDSGKLTIELAVEGGPLQIAVTSLTCSDHFIWTATGGDFTPFDSLEDAVSRGNTWKVRCIVDVVRECEALPITEEGPYCENNEIKVTMPGRLYQCSLPRFVPEPGAIRMRCFNDVAPKIRYADDVEKVIVPTCTNAQWYDAGTPIDSTTKVVCASCRRFTQRTTDDEKVDFDSTQTKAVCETKPLVIDVEDFVNGAYVSLKKIPVDEVICNANLQIWESFGGDLGEYESLDNILSQGLIYSLRCLNPGENQ